MVCKNHIYRLQSRNDLCFKVAVRAFLRRGTINFFLQISFQRKLLRHYADARLQDFGIAAPLPLGLFVGKVLVAEQPFLLGGQIEQHAQFLRQQIVLRILPCRLR